MRWSIVEAKAKLSELIKFVQNGEPATITNHGTPVATVVPPPMLNVFMARLFQLREWLGNASISRMSEAMELPKAGDLGCYFDGAEEPSFEFLEKVAKRFRCRPDWLKHGESEAYPWDKLTCDYIGAESILQTLEKLAPKEIFFVRIDHQDRKPEDDLGEAGLILKWDALTYQVFGMQVHVSSHVGGTGALQLWTLSRLTQLLPQNRQWHVVGKTLSVERFKNIFGGRQWAGLVERAASSTWWDDLVDFNHGFPVAGEDGEGYARHYGESFRDAQTVLRHHAKERAQRESQAEAPQEVETMVGGPQGESHL
jgi:prevent-host-death family protein